MSDLILPNIHPPHFVDGEVALVTIYTFPVFCAWVTERKQHAEFFFAADQVDASVYAVMTAPGKSVADFRRKCKHNITLMDTFTASHVAKVMTVANITNYERILNHFRADVLGLVQFVWRVCK